MTINTAQAASTSMSKGTAGVNSDVLVELQLMQAGYCRHPEALTLRGGTWRAVSFPAGFALIRHPHYGYILFDTGYSERFFAETSRLPQLLYRWVTPVTLRGQEDAVHQLRRQGVAADEIRYVVLSHFHADHIAGLRDFPCARIVYKREAYAAVRHLGSIASVRAGYLAGLLPDDFQQRSIYVEDADLRLLPDSFPFPEGYDLLGDGSLIAVDISGHAAGQIGLFVRTASGECFLCADAVWSSRAYREGRRPHAAARLIMADGKRYEQSFERLCRLHRHYPQLAIVPSHCDEAYAQQAAERRVNGR